MPLSKAQLEALSKDRDGDLAQVPFSRLLAAMALFERTVVLELHRGQLNKKVVVEFGVPVDCRSNLVHETLGRYLAATGKLSEEEAEALFRDALAQRIPLGELLVQRGKLSHPELFRVLQMNLAKKLLDLSAKFHPLRFEPAALKDLAEKASDLFLALARAYTHLKTAALLLPKDPRPQEALKAIAEKKKFWK